MEELKTHQELGEELNLFFASEYSPGSSFFLPDGQHIYRKLEEYFRKQYFRLGYQEIQTPNIFSQDLWKKSGHWDKYKENMFHLANHKHQEEEKKVAEDNQDESDDMTSYSLKPMNCPADCLIFKKMLPSYQQLPVRLADFGVLHRNEFSGSLRGLTRVRKFCQDDAHIFCMPDQLDDEINRLIDMVIEFYQLVGLSISMELSTRPDQYIGDLENWDLAESILEKHLQKRFPDKWKKNIADGAFYGPKIDFHATDSLGRSHQTATIQLDFNLPERFDLKYKDSDNQFKRPIMIHRAVMGSFERFLAILLEDHQGHLPFWMSPRQVVVIPISNKVLINQETGEVAPFLREVEDRFHRLSYDLKYSVDLGDDHLKNKIKNAHKNKYCYQVIIGAREMKEGKITLQDYQGKKVGEGSMTLDEMEEYLRQKLI